MRSGITTSNGDHDRTAAGRPVPARQRAVAGRGRDPGGPRGARAVPHAARRRRGAPAGDRRGGCGRRRPSRARPARKVGDLYASFLRRGPGRGAAAPSRSWPTSPRSTAVASVASCSGCRARCSARGSAAPVACSSARTPATARGTSCTSSSPVSGCRTSRTTARTRSPRSAPRTSSTSPRCCSSPGSPTTRTPPGRLPTGSWRSRPGSRSDHWDVVRNRDAVKTYNLVDRAGLQALSPTIDWDAWLDGLGAPAGAFDEVVVRQPELRDRARVERSPTSISTTGSCGSPGRS